MRFSRPCPVGQNRRIEQFCLLEEQTRLSGRSERRHELTRLVFAVFPEVRTPRMPVFFPYEQTKSDELECGKKKQAKCHKKIVVIVE